ncbi:hypothetical protein H6P81_020674 [Aristolochia fimbriata]|uniref:Uncharacterized protein n=1 Tax=Aristolochia fimbriata TaxID=158543 RepID=A0AAV7DVE3_ARIFI|nr:hypothetical protein H6P81_020674 [Aristolochia fimbriata]
MNIPEATSTVEDDVERADWANWEIQRLRRSSRNLMGMLLGPFLLEGEHKKPSRRSPGLRSTLTSSNLLRPGRSAWFRLPLTEGPGGSHPCPLWGPPSVREGRSAPPRPRA